VSREESAVTPSSTIESVVRSVGREVETDDKGEEEEEKDKGDLPDNGSRACLFSFFTVY
jgi:hypothetical protein